MESFYTSSVAIVQKNPKLQCIMWQRIQTIYMLLGAMAFFSIGVYDPSNTESLVAGLGVALLFANITYFRFRKRQFIINRIVIIIAFFLEGLIIYPIFQLSGNEIPNNNFIILSAPLMAVVFMALANRSIQKDEKNVNSADRFRSK